MTAWILSSCGLILAVIIIRWALGGHISGRVRSLLWLAVLLRLLVPVSPLHGNVSVMNALPQKTPATEYTDSNAASDGTQTAPVGTGGAGQTGGETAAEGNNTGASAGAQSANADFDIIARLVWLYGGMAVGIWFALANITFYLRLSRSRERREVQDCPLPVYVSGAAASPCLFGFIRPAVYITPEAADSDNLEYVIRHEYTHFRRGDNWRSLARCACLALWWWNPLVWLAAILSREDGELACDEAVLRAVGPEKRFDYAQTLLDMTAGRRRDSSLSLAAAGLESGGREMKRRLERIAKKPRIRPWAGAAAAALTLLLAGCAFSDAKTESQTVSLTAQELTYFNTEFFNGSDMDSTIRNIIVNDTFDTPAGVNLYQMFYLGTGYEEDEGALTAQEISSLGYDDSICGVDRLPRAHMDAVLEKNLGISLSETEGRGLGMFSHTADNDTYYHAHGDTNYGRVTVGSGYTVKAHPDTVYLECTAFGGSREVVLNKTDDGYTFQSCSRSYTDIEVTKCSEDMTKGFTVDYAGDKTIVFHNAAGVFVYDIQSAKITQSLDFVNLLGAGADEGDVHAAVRVWADGSMVEVYLTGDENMAIALCLHTDKSWYMPVGSSDHSRIDTDKTVSAGGVSLFRGAPGQIKDTAQKPTFMLNGTLPGDMTLSVNGGTYKIFENSGVNTAVSIDPIYYGITEDMLAMKTAVDFKTLSVNALGAFYLNSDGAGAEGSGEELYQRFMADPSTVLEYIKSLGDAAVTGRGSAREELCHEIAAANVYWHDADPAFAELLEKSKKNISDAYAREIITLIQDHRAGCLAEQNKNAG